MEKNHTLLKIIEGGHSPETESAQFPGDDERVKCPRCLSEDGVEVTRFIEVVDPVYRNGNKLDTSHRELQCVRCLLVKDVNTYIEIPD